ncbi:endo alpha-1,4 polygalactosaminidase [Deinococcus pimensis]|uniref:endo alpha-1,4 polygalactosaminidase n=1 Tax=Deinococcus pimensis TaxID=309888 RepID=UPI0005EB928C|nr:endo alpha-1,4 polygalactosaminidase [Deinococcus pimensis]
MQHRIMGLLALTCLLAACGQTTTTPIAESATVTPQATITTTTTTTTTYRRPPAGRVAWDWQIGASSSQIKVPAGAVMLDVDGFETSATRVAQLKAQGIYTVCYINAGSYEGWRPDASKYPAYLKIQTDPDWPDESFLDVRDVFKPGSVLAGILNARFQMCKDKGFDAVEPDNLQNDENVTSGVITKQNQIDFNGWVADAVHAKGLAVFQKNGPDNVLLRDRTGAMMVDKFDGMINEECQQYGECAPLAEYVKRGKPALNVEYRKAAALDCSLVTKYGIGMMKRDLSLRAPGMSGYVRQICS